MFDFTTHPKNVCMSYTEHAKHSLYFSMILLISSLKSFVHAIFPNIFITSTSDLSNELIKIIKESGCNKDK